MIQPILIGITMLVSVLGFFRIPQPLIWDNAPLNLGATSFPASLDALTNPSGTDSVATISHSGQHSNANDAIEALEAKLGIGASTATNNTIFVGNGTGSSAFSTSATSTNFLATNLTSASTTMASTSIQTLLVTKATTTDLFVSNLASTTNVRANVANLGNLTVTSCTGCSVAASGFEKASSTSTTLPGTISTSTPLTVGHKVLIFGHCNVTVSNDTRTIALYVKPASSATSTALAQGTSGDTSTGDDTFNIHITGLYNVAATESHEIYIGNPADNKRQTICNSGDARGITYVVLN